MKSNIIYGILIVLFVLPAQAQRITSQIHLSKDSVLIGDKIQLNIQVKYPKDIVIKGLSFNGFEHISNARYAEDTVRLDRYADLTILDSGNWKNITKDYQVTTDQLNPVLSGDDYIIENTITVAIYNEGTYQIPVPVLIHDTNETTIPATTNPVNVYLPVQMKSDSVTLNPIKDIMREKVNLSDYVWVLYILMALIAIVLLALYWKRRKKTDIEVVTEVPTIIPPHVKALSALKHLKSKTLWQTGNIKAYQSELTDIVRVYLEDRYQVNALEMTTDEITTALEKTAFDVKYKKDLKEILQVADLVKFAKAVPELNIHDVFMEKAVEFVVHTQVQDSNGKIQNLDNHD